MRAHPHCLYLLLLSAAALLFNTSDAAAQTTSWRDSLATLNKQIAEQPHSTDLRLRKAAVNIELQQWEYAIEEYGRVLDIDAQNLSAFYFRAFAYSHLRRYDMACADYERFLAIMPRNFDAQLALGLTLQRMGKNAKALDRLNMLVEMYPDSALAYAARADIEHQQGHYELALYDWDEALRHDAGNVDFLSAKYRVLWAMKRYDEARSIEAALRRKGLAPPPVDKK